MKLSWSSAFMRDSCLIYCSKPLPALRVSQVIGEQKWEVVVYQANGKDRIFTDRDEAWDYAETVAHEIEREP